MSMNILAHRINMDSSWNKFDVFDHDYPIIDYPDLDYPDFTVIRTFSLIPILPWIFIGHDQDP